VWYIAHVKCYVVICSFTEHHCFSATIKLYYLMGEVSACQQLFQNCFVIFHWILASGHWALSVVWAVMCQVITAMQCILFDIEQQIACYKLCDVFCMSVGCYKLEMWLWSDLMVSNVSTFCVCICLTVMLLVVFSPLYIIFFTDQMIFLAANCWKYVWVNSECCCVAEDGDIQELSDSVAVRHTFIYFKVKKLSLVSHAVCDAAFVDSQHTTLLLVCLHYYTMYSIDCIFSRLWCTFCSFLCVSSIKK